jgi:hypothetical protein
MISTEDTDIRAILAARFGTGDPYPAEALLVAHELGADDALLDALAYAHVERADIRRPGVSLFNHGVRLTYVHVLLASGADLQLVRELFEHLATNAAEHWKSHVQAFWNDDQAIQALYADRDLLIAFLTRLAAIDPENVLSHHGQIIVLVQHDTANRIQETGAGHLTRVTNHRQFQTIVSLRRHVQITLAARISSNHPWNLVLKGYVLGHYYRKYTGHPAIRELLDELRQVMAVERPGEAPARWRWLAEGFRRSCGSWENGLAAMDRIPELLAIFTDAGLIFQRVRSRPIPGGELLEVPLQISTGQAKLRHRPGQRGELVKHGDTVIICPALVEGHEPNFQAGGTDVYVLELHPAARPSSQMFTNKALAFS